ncbi:cytochrome P450 [Mycena epipterygia]|nr:cytochrome P450 [Mycena epipterygia]
MISQILLPIAATLFCYVLFHAVQSIYRNLTSPLRHMIGPKNPSFILGNFKEMAEDLNLTQKWRNEFGRNFEFKGLFSISQLHTSDIKALNHIVTNNSVYQRAPSNRVATRNLLGKGILATDGDEHKRHRRILNPAFGVAQIRLVTEVFVEKAAQLRDIWAREIVHETATIEVLSGLRRMTLDVIGQAGFNYQFDALDSKGKPNELDQVFTQLLHSPRAQLYTLLRVVRSLMPILKLFPLPGSRVEATAHKKMHSIGAQLVLKSKADIKIAEGDKTLSGKRDLLSVLLKANLATNIPEIQRLNEAEVIAQIPTFFFAGHETTSSSASWALHALSLNIAAQTKLREELLTISTENPTMDELNALPYLDMVIRETMRVHSPVMFTQRMAMKDDVLPLSKPYIDKAGKSHDSLPIPKGQMIHIPIWGVNTDKEIWGDDADEFIPERWEHLPDAVSDIPSVWANLFTFFAGPTNCIGFRFALVEMKVLLFTLIRAFEFAPAVPKGGIVSSAAGLIQRPTVLAHKGDGTALPLIVKAFNVQGY